MMDSFASDSPSWPLCGLALSVMYTPPAMSIAGEAVIQVVLEGS